MKFFRRKTNWILFLIASFLVMSARPLEKKNSDDGEKERQYLVESLVKIANPVLTALSENKLKEHMPVEALREGREKYTYLEAFGRLLAGMAPWLALGPDNSAEGKLRAKYIQLSRICLHNATDRKSVV